MISAKVESERTLTKLAGCPLCQSKAAMHSYTEQPNEMVYWDFFGVKCTACACSFYRRIKPFNMITSFTVEDFRNDNDLRVQEQNAYEEYAFQKMESIIGEWNTRPVDAEAECAKGPSYSSQQVCKLEQSVQDSARRIQKDADLGGGHTIVPNQMLERFVAWHDGFLCGTGRREFSLIYGDVIKKADLANDPEYQEYLKLKEKFQDVESTK